MKGLHIRYLSLGRPITMRVGSLAYDGELYQQAHDHDPGEGKIFRLKCRCGADNWTDNGRDVNEFECDSCGQFVTAIEYKERPKYN